MQVIIPADQPAYVPVGGNELMLVGEFSRTVNIDCTLCDHIAGFKLVTDEILTPDRCDQLLNRHLESLGWRITGDDICPSCVTVEG